MKKVLFLLVVFIASASVSAQSGPKIEFVNGTTLDYGTVTKEEDSGIRKFEIKNVGDAPLIITDVKSTCGCTVPTKPKEPIMPGKTDIIEVKYNMNPGPIRKTITVESNAVNYPEGMVPLKIKGEVIVKQEVNLLEKKKSIMMQ
jgi:hypothetical protein